MAKVSFPPIEGFPAGGLGVFLSPTKAMILISTRYKGDDQFWFTYVHLLLSLLRYWALHIRTTLKPGQRKGRKPKASLQEPAGLTAAASADQQGAFKQPELLSAAESQLVDRLAADLLIPPEKARLLPTLKTPEAIDAFARAIEVAPGIVVGRMQHDDLISYLDPEMNALKREVDLSWLLCCGDSVRLTWFSIVQAMHLVKQDFDLAESESRHRISQAIANREFFADGQGRDCRIERISFNEWRTRQRDLQKAQDSQQQDQQPAGKSRRKAKSKAQKANAAQWGLKILHLPKDPIAVAHRLCKTLRLPPDHAAEMVRKMPGIVVTGPFDELEDLPDQLRLQHGVVAEVTGNLKA